jgi:DNA-binding NarL/FixJ family response regulator
VPDVSGHAGSVGPAAVRVLIVDDDTLVRSALSLMLGGRDDLEIVGEASDGDQVVEAVRSHTPDVVLMDIRMPRRNGIEATRDVAALADAPRVIVLTTFDTEEHVFEALAAGADGFLVKDTAPADLVAAIKTVAAGETMLSPSVASMVVAQVRDGGARPNEAEARSLLDTLTAREAEVATAIGRGLSNADIAEELFMSVATVKAHVTRVFEKLGATNRVQVAIRVHDAGLI